jgi:Spy/CpxP family protein refolding chaperone
MKRLMVMFIVLFLASASSAVARQDEQKQEASKEKMGMMHGMMQGKMGGMMRGMMNGRQGGPMAFLKLTEEQQAKVQDLGLAHQKEMITARAELQKQRAAMTLEITAEKFNEGKVKSIQSEISKLTGEIAMKTVMHQRAIRDLLTPEQRKQFDHHILSGGMMGRRGPMGPGSMMRRGGMMGRNGMRGGMRGQRGMGNSGMAPRGSMNGAMDSSQCKCMD